MDRATKLIVFGWACAALAFEVHLVAAIWDQLFFFSVAVFTIALVCCAFDPRCVAGVLVFTYIFPVLIRAGIDGYASQFDVLVMAGVLGAIAPAALRTNWHLPARWRAPLVAAALITAVGVVIVVARELDFSAALLDYGYLRSSALSPANVVSWVVHAGLVLVFGILWFDWLMGLERGFYAGIVAPLAASAAVMAAVSVYQLFGDVTFLNPTIFGAQGRASGTMFDANVCGTLAALWIGGVVLCADRLTRWQVPVLTGGVTLGWLTVWAAGSRTAFAAAVIVTACALVSFNGGRRRGAWPIGALHVCLAAAVTIVVVVLLARAHVSVVGPLRRLWQTLPALSTDSVRSFAAEMWNRNRYGSAATAMIRQFPLFGVGVGCFSILLPDFAILIGGGPLPPDNAQNWYRHQFVEFGLIGSVGWIAWVVVFGWFVLRRRPSDPAAAWTARGMLIAFALISLFGMPGQDVMVVVTFWTVAFWYVSLVGIPSPPACLSARTWVLIVALLVVYAGGTADAAIQRLRVPFRAQRGGWPYSYGFADPEPDASGESFRRAGRRAVAVVDAPTEWLALSVSLDPRNAVVQPVDVKLWRDRELVLRSRLRTAVPLTQYVRVPSHEKRVLIETSATRVAGPNDSDVERNREPEVMVRWTFVDAPPAEAQTHGR
jgi:O-antigen ligase/polysaccharide polymerase Wzy-like membrane protein